MENNKGVGQFARFSLNTIAVQFIILAVSVFTSIITARVLGPEGKGKLTLIFLIPWLAYTLGRMGIGHAVNYYASKVSTTKLIINTIVLSMVLTVLVMAVTFPILFNIKDLFLKTVSENLLILIPFLIPLYMLTNHFMSLLQGLYKIDIRNFLLVSQSVINLLLLVMLIIILKMGLNGAIAASVIASLFLVFLSAIFLLKEIKPEEVGLDFNLMRQFSNFGLKSHIGNVLKDLSYRSDILIISYFLPVDYVGYYAIAVTIAEIVWNIPDAVGVVLLPRIAHMDNKSAKSFTPIVSRIVIIIVLISCFIIYIFSKDIILLAFGLEFLPSSFPLQILLPGVLFLSLWKIIANDLIAQGYPTKYSLTSGTALVTMILLDLLLIPKFGINGAAAASTISYIAATVLIVFIYIRITSNSIKDLIIPNRSDFLYIKKMLLKGV